MSTITTLPTTIDVEVPIDGAQPAGPPPPPYYPPVEIAPDTFVIQATQGEGVAPVAVHLNAMVIRGPEPMIVDTGMPIMAERYLDDMWNLVDPEDVRWVFLSHDDLDHHGNLEAVMATCPHATLVTSWFAWERLGNLPAIAPWRMRWVADGETFEANGRTYAAVRPPLYDSPTTRGLFDPQTGVYWASDCFATTVPHGMPDVSGMDREEWTAGLIANAHGLSPWVVDIDERRYHANVGRLAGLGITTVASCHSPAITGGDLEYALDVIRAVPSAPVQPTPGAELLDGIIAGMLDGAPS